MGQKVNPNGFRVGIIKDWESTWFTEKDYAKFVIQDENIRVYLHKELKESFVSKVKIERNAEGVTVRVITARPGIVLGQGGENVAKLEKEIAKLNGKKIIFTNGSKAHAANVTKRIGIEKLFDGVFDIVDSDFVPKPSKQPYKKIIENFWHLKQHRKNHIARIMNTCSFPIYEFALRKSRF